MTDRKARFYDTIADEFRALRRTVLFHGPRRRHAGGRVHRALSHVPIDHGQASWKSGPTLLEQPVRRLPLKKKRSKKLINWARRGWPRRSGIERRGVPYVKAGGAATYDSLVHTVLDARGTFQYNAPDWGFGEHSFPERVIAASRVLPA